MWPVVWVTTVDKEYKCLLLHFLTVVSASSTNLYP